MPAEVLVMCSRCGRPQPAGKRCVACGVELPEVVVAPGGANTTRNQAQTSFEAELGHGRRLSLSGRRLEWREKEHPRLTYQAHQLESVTLRARPVYEALAFLLPMLMTVVLGQWLRVLGLGLGLAALWACFTQRRYSLRLRTKQGGTADLMLGVGRPGSPLGVRLLGVWQALAPELRALGIQAEDGVSR